MINVKLPWPPSVNHYYAVVRGRKVLSKKGREYKTESAVECLRQKAPRSLTQRLEVCIDAYPPDKRKRDLDNIVKPIFDALQDYGMFDDSQIDDFRVRRREIAKPGYVRVYISEIET